MNIRCFYEKSVLFLTCIMLSVFIQTAAKCEGINKWNNEYKSYGRTININVDISVPDKDKIPFLAIEPMNELSAEDLQKNKDIFDNLNQTDDQYTFINKNNLIAISYRDHESNPDLSDAEKVTTPYRPLLDYDRDIAYAEDNDLTINEAEYLVNNSIQFVFPSVTYQVQDLIVNDRTKDRKSGEKLTDKGYYEMYCLQEINGIPIAGSIHEAYKYERTKHDRVIGDYGTAYVLVTDHKNFEGRYTLWNKTSELGTPDQLLSFDTIKPKIEEMIMTGNIRNIYHVYLGYAQYDMPEGNKYAYILSPAWVIWADYLDTPAEELEQETVNGSGAYMELAYYKPIIINAVTGDVTDPLSENEDRMLLPTSCMEWVEGN